MQKILPKSLKTLAKCTPVPLYVVGGAVRDHLAGFIPKTPDWDICAPLAADEFAKIAEENGFAVRAVYRNTGTVKFLDTDGQGYEYSCFRSDKYVRGIHTPVEIFFTNDIVLDAKRRDFTANAIYYDITAQRFVDPLLGIPAIREKRLTTVDDPKKVFGEDGLRLMRLARQAAQLGFTPDEACLAGARENASLIRDISPERIYAELTAILTADTRYNVKDGHYRGLKILDETRVLDHILPELTLGRDMRQRADFHKYDVLEHSLRAVLYATENTRLAALLHDVGKPYCAFQFGNFFAHPAEGERLAREILLRLKAPNKETDNVCRLVRLHMRDFDCRMSEGKLRRLLVQNYPLLPDLLAVKQADFSACMDNTNAAPTCKRWRALLAKMQAENVPFTLRELAVKGNELIELGIPPKHISELLNALLMHTATEPKDNTKERLLRLAVGLAKSLTEST